MASRRARSRQHEKRRPIPDQAPIDWAKVEADQQQRQQAQQQPRKD